MIFSNRDILISDYIMLIRLMILVSEHVVLGMEII